MMNIRSRHGLAISTASLVIFALLHQEQSFGVASMGFKMVNQHGRNNGLQILCGQSALSLIDHHESSVSNRIHGGRIARPGELPFQVHFEVPNSDLNDNNNRKRICGGVIIDETTILTAAHCVVDYKACWIHHETVTYQAQLFRVFVGDHNRLESDGEIEVTISDAIAHPFYCLNDKALYDIAMLKTQHPMTWQLDSRGFGSVNRICMPESEEQEYKTGDIVTVSGWGQFENSSDINSPSLRLADVKIIEADLCKVMGVEQVGSGTICASTANGTDSCGGDSGGPLFRKRPAPIGCNQSDDPQCGEIDQVELVGLVSHGSSKECADGNPAVYTLVSEHLKWIQDYKRMK